MPVNFELIGSLVLLASVIGIVITMFMRMGRQMVDELNQSTLGFLDARRLLEVEEDRDTLILTRSRVEPLITVSDVRFDRRTLWFDLEDGRVIGAPLVRWHQLAHIKPSQRQQWRLAGDGSLVVWDDLELRISVRVLMGHEP